MYLVKSTVFTSHGRYGYKCHGQKIDGLKDILAALFYPDYTYDAAIIPGIGVDSTSSNRKKKFNPHLSTEKRITNGMRRGNRLDRGMIATVPLKLRYNFQSEVFARPHPNVTREECAKRMGVSEWDEKQKQKDVDKCYDILRKKNMNSTRQVWKALIGLTLEPIQCQVMVGLEGVCATAIDLDVLNPSKKHVIIQLKTGNHRIHHHTGKNCRYPFETLTDSLYNQYLIQVAAETLMFENTAPTQPLAKNDSLVVRSYPGNVEVDPLPVQITRVWDQMKRMMIRYKEVLASRGRSMSHKAARIL